MPAREPVTHDAPWAGRVAEADHSAALERVREDGCALAIWRRSLKLSLGLALANLMPGELDDIFAEVPVDRAALHVAALLGGAGYPTATAVALAEDIGLLATIHAAIGDWSLLKMRLDWVEANACRRFHADLVETRLLTTYVGRGTQWRYAEDDNADARTLGTGVVAIFKGRVLAPDAPILHRSPPIAGTGERRLLLVIDGPTPAEPDGTGRA